VETVAAILERASQITIQAWFTRIQTDARVMSVPLNYDDRCGICLSFSAIWCLVSSPLNRLGAKSWDRPLRLSTGLNRRRLGYTTAMMVEE
jgi:hypothetical protein